MRLNVYFEKLQKKNKFQRFDSVSSHLVGEGIFEKIFPESLYTLGGTLTTLSRSDGGRNHQEGNPRTNRGVGCDLSSLTML